MSRNSDSNSTGEMRLKHTSSSLEFGDMLMLYFTSCHLCHKPIKKTFKKFANHH